MANFAAKPKVSVLGGGAWGCALAHHFAGRNRLGYVFTHYPGSIEAINHQQQAPKLQGVTLHANVRATGDIAQSAEAEILILACSASALNATLSELKPHIRANHQIILAAKGILEDAVLPHQLARDILPDVPLMLLSGPSFAADLARGRLVAVILAGEQQDIVQKTAMTLSSTAFRLYTSLDLHGVALCGALKNIIAIGTGICRGLNVGLSAEAALISRGLSEMAKITRAHGGKNETIQGLAGLGDLLMTCASEESRNMRFGLALAKGLSPQESLEQVGATVEGYHTARIIPKLCAEASFDIPIIQTICDMLYGGVGLREAVESLLYRPSAKPE